MTFDEAAKLNEWHNVTARKIHIVFVRRTPKSGELEEGGIPARAIDGINEYTFHRDEHYWPYIFSKRTCPVCAQDEKEVLT